MPIWIYYLAIVVALGVGFVFGRLTAKRHPANVPPQVVSPAPVNDGEAKG